MVADNDSGESVESEVRTSSGMFLRKAQVSETLILFSICILLRLMFFIFYTNLQ